MAVDTSSYNVIIFASRNKLLFWFGITYYTSL